MAILGLGKIDIFLSPNCVGCTALRWPISIRPQHYPTNRRGQADLPFGATSLQESVGSVYFVPRSTALQSSSSEIFRYYWDSNLGLLVEKSRCYLYANCPRPGWHRSNKNNFHVTDYNQMLMLKLGSLLQLAFVGISIERFTSSCASAVEEDLAQERNSKLNAAMSSATFFIDLLAEMQPCGFFKSHSVSH